MQNQSQNIYVAYGAQDALSCCQNFVQRHHTRVGAQTTCTLCVSMRFLEFVAIPLFFTFALSGLNAHLLVVFLKGC